MVLVPIKIDGKLPHFEEITLLGEWCENTYTNSILKVNTLPYHWSNKKKFSEDCIYLFELTDKIMPYLAEALNNYHHTQYSIKFWKCTCGLWLNIFIASTFDRWSMAEVANNSYELKEVLLLDIDKHSIIPNDLNHFSNLSESSDEWNSYIYHKLFLRFDGLIIKKIQNFKKYKSLSKILHFKALVKLSTHKILDKLLYFFSKNNQIIFVDSYFSIKDLWKLELRLKQFPSFFIFNEKIKKTTINIQKRQEFDLQYSPINDFESFLISLIHEQIPSSYLEDYDEIVSKFKSFPVLSSVEVIYTANAHLYNDQFNIWSAHAIDNDVKMIYGQHGGGTRSLFHDSILNYELSTCDSYIPWGEGGRPDRKHVVLPVNKFSNNKKKINKINKGILLILDCKKRYPSDLYSNLVQYSKYLSDQKSFISLIDKKIVSDLKVRPNPNSKKQGWASHFQIELDYPNDSNKSFIKSIQKQRLVVISCNETTLLQSLAMNIPTIAFWDASSEVLNKESIIFYRKLTDVGVLHKSPESAATFINENWQTIESWWNNKELQIVRSEFCRNFIYTSSDNDKISQWTSFFDNLKK